VSVDYTIGFTQAELEQILAVHKAELLKVLASWSDGAGSVTKLRRAELEKTLGEVQDALKKLDPETYGGASDRRTAQSVMSATFCK
jgi:ElaB/YqjD/DUF883 family membrane-anchored ribosome-binding protein